MAEKTNETGVLPGHESWVCSAILDETKDN
jgi:hypothetical protein